MTKREALAIFDEMAVRYFKAHRWKELDAIYAAQDALLAQQQAEENDPLTLDELRRMEGEPVWEVTERLKEWCIVHSYNPNDVIGGGVIMIRRTAVKRTYPYTDFGKTWLAYRRKPEEGAPHD